MICGEDTPKAPYPVYLRGTVEHGYGRGSKQLNCATANLPISALDDPVNDPQHRLHETGVYFGYAQVRFRDGAPHVAADREIYPMVMSLGWNPQFQNQQKSIEVHILHNYAADFYGEDMHVIVLGYIRQERKYANLEALMDDIDIDKRVGLNSLDRPTYCAYQKEDWFS